MLDPQNNVLLFKYEDGPRRWWATPVGGLEDKETFEDAGTREAAEELSLVGARLKPLWRQTVEFVRQREHFFLVRLPKREVALGCAALQAQRREGIIAARWWSLNELQQAPDAVFPEDLCERIQGLQP